MNINNLETLDSDNYTLNEINLDNLQIPIVTTSNQVESNDSDFDNNGNTEINITFEKDNDNQDGGELEIQDDSPIVNIEKNILSDGSKDEVIELNSPNILDDEKKSEQEEYDNSEALLHLTLGDYVEIESSLKELSTKGFLFYLDNKYFEIKTDDNQFLRFEIHKQRINKVIKIRVIEKNTYSNLIGLYNLKVGDKIKVFSSNNKYHLKLAKIISINDNIVSILIEDEKHEIDLTYGLSKISNSIIYDFEIVNEIEEEESEIEMLDDVDIVMEYEVKEENVICTLEEGHTCLISDLMKLFEYQKNLEQKEIMVSKIVFNLIEDLLNRERSESLLDKPKLDKYIKSDFTDSNIIPLVSLKKKIYERIEDEQNENFISADLEKELKDLNQCDKQFRENIYSKWGNNYEWFYKDIQRNMETFRSNEEGYNISLNKDSEVIDIINNNSINIMKGLGSVELFYDNRDDDYIFEKNKDVNQKSIFPSEQLSLNGFVYYPGENKFNATINLGVNGKLKDLVNNKNKNSQEVYKKKLQSGNISLLSIPDGEVDYNDYFKNIVICKFSSKLDTSVYTDPSSFRNTILNKIVPGLVDIIKLRKRNKIFCLNDFYKYNKLLSTFEMSLTHNHHNNSQIIYNILSKNIKMKNSPEYSVNYPEILESSRDFKSTEPLFINNSLLGDSLMEELYNFYPDYNKLTDDELNRFRWLHNSFDNGAQFFKNYHLNESSNDKDSIQKLIKSLNVKIEELAKNPDILNRKQIGKQFTISKVYIDQIKNEKEAHIKTGDYGLSINTKKGKVSLLKKMKINNDLIWVQESYNHNQSGNIFKSIRLSDKCIEEEKEKLHKYNANEKEIIDHLRNLTDEGLCIPNGCQLQDFDFEKSNSNNHIQYDNHCISFKENKLEHFKRLKSNYESYLNKLEIHKKLIQNEKINIDNIKFQNKKQKETIETFLKNKNSQKAQIPEIEIEINKIKRLGNEYKRDRLIENIIKEKLRLPFENEDQDFFYETKTSTRVLSKHWQLKVQITSQPHNSKDIIEQLISKYGVSKRGSEYWICRIDGDQLSLIDYDSFEGYDNDDSDKKVREVLEEKNDRNLSVAMLGYNRVKINIFNTIEEINESLSFVDESDFKMSEQQNMVHDIYDYIDKFYRNYLIVEYRKKKISTSFESFLLSQLVERSIILLLCLCYYAIYFQTHLPILNPPHIKLCQYTLSGDPSSVSNDTNDDFIDYFSCIVYHNRFSLTKNGRVLFSKFQNISQDELTNKLKSTYVKLGKEKYIIKLFKRWNQYLKNKHILNTHVWKGFRPNFSIYNKKKIFSQEVMSDMDKYLNSTTDEFITDIKNEHHILNQSKRIESLKKKIKNRNEENIYQYHIGNKGEPELQNLYYKIFPDKMSNDIAIKITSHFSVHKDTFGAKKLYSKYGFPINSFEEENRHQSIEENITDAHKILKFIQHKNKHSCNFNAHQIDFNQNIQVITDLATTKVFKEDSELLSLKKDVESLYINWKGRQSETDKEDVIYKFEFNVNTYVKSIKNYLNNKTYHHTEHTNINLVIDQIEFIFGEIYSDYSINLYSKSINELVMILSLIKNRKQHIRNAAPKKLNLETESLKIINKFITDEINYENTMLSYFSKNFNDEHANIKSQIDTILKEIRGVSLCLSKINAENDSLNNNIKISKFNIKQKFIVYKYCFYKILLFIMEYYDNSSVEQSITSFIYLFMNNLLKKNKDYYFTRKQIRTKRSEEIEEENNLTKNRRANMSEERKQIDNLEQRMGIGFYAKSGKFEFKKGFNQ